MLAPVYRHLDARGGIFGLSALEWGPVLFTAWFGMTLDRPNLGLMLAAAMWAGLRIAGHGRPAGFLQHLLAWRARQVRSRGRLSAAVRARAPRFPFGPYEFREPPRPGGAKGGTP